MQQENVIGLIKEAADRILPPTASLWLYGSRARGDARPDSDYDLLILLDKDHISASDFDNYSYPLFLMGLGINEEINAHIYPRKDWAKWDFVPFHDNVEEEKIVLR